MRGVKRWDNALTPMDGNQCKAGGGGSMQGEPSALRSWCACFLSKYVFHPKLFPAEFPIALPNQQRIVKTTICGNLPITEISHALYRKRGRLFRWQRELFWAPFFHEREVLGNKWEALTYVLFPKRLLINLPQDAISSDSSPQSSSRSQSHELGMHRPLPQENWSAWHVLAWERNWHGNKYYLFCLTII